MNPRDILIIEDDTGIQAVTKFSLEMDGHWKVNLANCGKEGLLKAKTINPDVILLDISMPGGDGFNVAQRVRKIIGSEPVIIFLTAHKEPELRQRAMEFGAAGFIEKPYDADRIIELIAKAA